MLVRVKVYLTVNKWKIDSNSPQGPKKVKIKIKVNNNESLERIHEMSVDAISTKHKLIIESSTLEKVKLIKLNVGATFK